MASATVSIATPVEGHSPRGLFPFACFTLAFNLGVILWGAYVRATGSGAGCGNHWPLCNGEIIPRAQQIQTYIEFTHRVSAGISLLLVLALWFWCRRAMARRHPSRFAAGAAVLLIVNEALLGASLVLFERVAQDQSLARTISLSLHSANTLLLLAAIALTAFWLARPGSRFRWSRTRLLPLMAVLAFMLLSGATGAIAALGDTLFPAASLRASVAQDFAAGSHHLLHTRITHPAAALITVVFLVWTLAGLRRSSSLQENNVALLATGLFGIQLLLGVLNVVLLAPVWLQIVHLLAADLLWLSLIVLAGYRSETQDVSRLPSPVPR